MCEDGWKQLASELFHDTGRMPASCEEWNDRHPQAACPCRDNWRLLRAACESWAAGEAEDIDDWISEGFGRPPIFPMSVRLAG